MHLSRLMDALLKDRVPNYIKSPVKQISRPNSALITKTSHGRAHKTIGESTKVFKKREERWNNWTGSTATASESRSPEGRGRSRLSQTSGGMRHQDDRASSLTMTPSPINTIAEDSKYSEQNLAQHPQQRRSQNCTIPTQQNFSTARHRCLDNDVSQETLIYNGQYRLDNNQSKVYADFVKMLATFDPHDIVKILEDCVLDSQDATLLASYGGTVDPIAEDDYMGDSLDDC